MMHADNEAKLTISSPLEAHKSHTLVFALAPVDMGFDHPSFAAIELDYSEADQVRVVCNVLLFLCVRACACARMCVCELTCGLNHTPHATAIPRP